MMLKVIYVVVQFYPWFKFSFLLFQTHYYVIIIHYHTQKQKKRKLEPRIKLNHNINNIKTLKFSFLGCFRRLKQYYYKLLKIAKNFPSYLWLRLIVPHFNAEWTGIWTSKHWDVHQDHSAKHYGTTFDVCEELVPDTGRCCSYYTGEHFLSTRKASSGPRGGALGARSPLIFRPK